MLVGLGPAWSAPTEATGGSLCIFLIMSATWGVSCCNTKGTGAVSPSSPCPFPVSRSTDGVQRRVTSSLCMRGASAWVPPCVPLRGSARPVRGSTTPPFVRSQALQFPKGAFVELLPAGVAHVRRAWRSEHRTTYGAPEERCQYITLSHFPPPSGLPAVSSPYGGSHLQWTLSVALSPLPARQG